MAGTSDEATIVDSGSSSGERAGRAGPRLAPLWGGRYHLVERLAEGGMGEVFVAYDRELDRRVALKMLRRAAPSPEEEQRMLREAQALARLSHPNVVQVYDVGHHGDQLFVTMELVVGADLRAWGRAAPRTWREVLEVVLQAGEGLAAAHRAGLVHRDVKPDNILVGDDGRVRVADFGLARRDGGALPSGPLSDESLSAGALEAPLTERGAVLGTPAYMAPEQLHGAPFDARGDLFALCIVLYEGVYGQRPFQGKSRKQLADATLAGRVVFPPRDPPIPRWLTRALARGLAVEPARRFPDLHALLAELRRHLHAARRRWQWVGGLAGLGVGAALGATTLGAAPPCADADAALLALWDGARQAELRAALVAVAPELGEDLAGRLSLRFGRHFGALAEEAREACGAYRRGELSDALYDRRRDCLTRGGDEARALLDVFVAADAEVLARTISAADALSDPRRCSDPAVLLADTPPPDPKVAAELPGLDRELHRVHALRLSGRYQEAAPLVGPLVEAARRLGYEPRIVEALLERGLLDLESDFRAATVDLAEAVTLAEGAGADELRLSAMIGWLRGLGKSDAPRAQIVSTEAQILALVRRRRAAGRRVHGLALLVAGEAFSELDDFGAARGRLEAAVELLTPLGDEVAAELGEALVDLAVIHSRQGRHGQALGHYRQARALGERVLGARHPALGVLANNEARALERAGDLRGARARFADALAIWNGVHPPSHGVVRFATRQLARLDQVLRARDEERALAEAELAGAEGRGDLVLAEALLRVGRLDLLDGRHGEAQARGERALELLSRAEGAAGGPRAPALELLAAVAREAGRLDAALELAQQAHDLADDPLVRARARLERARVRWARDEAELARADAAAAEEEPGLREEAVAWLAGHPAPAPP